MSYIGKILVVVQLVLSLLFMAFAGAVFAINQNWKAKYEQSQKQLATAQKSASDSSERLTIASQDFDAKLAAQTQLANQFQAQNTGLTAQLAALREQNNVLEAQRQSQTGLAEAKSSEARFRQEEAEKRRVENDRLQVKLDDTSLELRQTRDQLFTREEEYRALNARYERNLNQVAYLQKIVASNNLETDPEKVAKLETPPPPVEGLVLEIQRNRTNRVNLVEISVGSDDGLVKGHEMDVVRVVGVDRPQWLGRIRIVDLSPDRAVAEVVQPAKNGIIQEGDNVTTKL